jgi:hypothetical protein
MLSDRVRGPATIMQDGGEDQALRLKARPKVLDIVHLGPPKGIFPQQNIEAFSNYLSLLKKCNP